MLNINAFWYLQFASELLLEIIQSAWTYGLLMFNYYWWLWIIIKIHGTGNTNYTGVLLKSNLQKSYNEWLLPLRTLVTGIMSENKTDYDEITVDIECALNPVELVLYRCIDLVEEKLRWSLKIGGDWWERWWPKVFISSTQDDSCFQSKMEMPKVLCLHKIISRNESRKTMDSVP